MLLITISLKVWSADAEETDRTSPAAISHLVLQAILIGLASQGTTERLECIVAPFVLNVGERASGCLAEGPATVLVATLGTA